MMEEIDADNGTEDPDGGLRQTHSWRGFSRVVLVVNLIAIVVSLGLLAAATSMTNIAAVFVYLPALGLQAVILIPLTLTACSRERSGVAGATLLLTLFVAMLVTAVGAAINLAFGARW